MNDPVAAPADTTAHAPRQHDLEHLRMLSLFHYILAAITALFSLFPVIHLVVGILMVNGKLEPQDAGAALAGWFFIGFAGLFIACGMTFAGFIAYAGRCLRQRRRHTLCLVVAGLECMMMPFGTLLGVFTLVALTKPQIRALFADR